MIMIYLLACVLNIAILIRFFCLVSDVRKIRKHLISEPEKVVVEYDAKGQVIPEDSQYHSKNQGV